MGRRLRRPGAGTGAPAPEMFASPFGDLTRASRPTRPLGRSPSLPGALAAVGTTSGYALVVDGQRAPTEPVPGSRRRDGLREGFVLGVRRLARQPHRSLVARRAHHHPVGSGEGLLSRSPILSTPSIRAGRGAGHPVPPRRVLHVEEELGALFNKMVVQESVEDHHQGMGFGALETTTKKSRCGAPPRTCRSSDIHTRRLYDRLDKRLMDNGYSNRWLYVLIKRTAVVARPPAPEAIPVYARRPTRWLRPLGIGAVDGRTGRIHCAGERDVRPHPRRHVPRPDVRGHGQTGGVVGSAALKSWLSSTRPLRGRRASTPSTLPHGRPGPGHRSAAAFFTGMTGNENADRLLAMWRDADFAGPDPDKHRRDVLQAHMSPTSEERCSTVWRDGVITRSTVKSGGVGGRPSTVIRRRGRL